MAQKVIDGNWMFLRRSGVYAYSDQPVETAELYVHYNVEFLEYSSGGELVKPGTVRVTVGDGNSIEAGTLLELIPRKPGSTAVTIASTKCKKYNGRGCDSFRSKCCSRCARCRWKCSGHSCSGK